MRIARIFNTYGPRMHENDGRVVSNFIVQALRNEPITIYGEGQQTRSFCYATDLIEGFVRLMASPHGVDPVNLGNPREITVLELAEMIKRLAKSKLGDHPRAAAQGRSRRAASPTSRAPRSCSTAGRRASRSRRAWPATIADFRKRLGAVGVRHARRRAAARSSGSPVTGWRRPGVGDVGQRDAHERALQQARVGDDEAGGSSMTRRRRAGGRCRSVARRLVAARAGARGRARARSSRQSAEQLVGRRASVSTRAAAFR